MNIEQAVRQAISAGSIAQSTVDALISYITSAADAHALNILAAAVSSNLVSVVET